MMALTTDAAGPPRGAGEDPRPRRLLRRPLGRPLGTTPSHPTTPTATRRQRLLSRAMKRFSLLVLVAVARARRPRRRFRLGGRAARATELGPPEKSVNLVLAGQPRRRPDHDRTLGRRALLRNRLGDAARSRRARSARTRKRRRKPCSAKRRRSPASKSTPAAGNDSVMLGRRCRSRRRSAAAKATTS